MLEIKINSSIKSLKRLKDIIASSIKIKNVEKMRLFNHKGLDIDESDVEYLSNAQVLYVSEGKNFNNINYLNEYEFIKNIKSGGYGVVYIGKLTILTLQQRI